MLLKANGKCIDTLPISSLFTQEEAYADTIVFEVDRHYNGMDLAEFAFTMRGVTESGGEAQSELQVTVDEEVLQLRWNVSEQFTAEGGTLQLDLLAVKYDDSEADPAADAPDHILRYQLPPVQVRALPDSDRVMDNASYTAFLLEVKETAENGIAEMSAILTEFESQQTDYDQQLTDMEKHLQTLKTRVDTHDEQIAAITPIAVLTQTEYDALEAPDESTLYVIKAE